FSVNLTTNTATERTQVLAYPETFTGGVSLAAGDVRRRGRASIITGPSQGGVPPIVRVWNLSGGGALVEGTSFQPYDEHAPGGVAVGAGDVTGLNGTNLITSPGPGTLPRLVKVFDAELATVLTIDADGGVGAGSAGTATTSVASGCISSFFPCPVAAPP